MIFLSLRVCSNNLKHFLLLIFLTVQFVAHLFIFNSRCFYKRGKNGCSVSSAQMFPQLLLKLSSARLTVQAPPEWRNWVSASFLFLSSVWVKMRQCTFGAVASFCHQTRSGRIYHLQMWTQCFNFLPQFFTNLCFPVVEMCQNNLKYTQLIAFKMSQHK